MRARDTLFIFLAISCGGGETNVGRTRVAPTHAASPPPPASSARAADDDERVIAGMRQAFRECYQIGLWNDPNQAGSIHLVLKIDALGRPASVTPVGGTGLSRMVVDCLVRVARRGSFAPRTAHDGSIVVPIKFGTDREAGAAPTVLAAPSGRAPRPVSKAR